MSLIHSTHAYLKQVEIAGNSLIMRIYAFLVWHLLTAIFVHQPQDFSQQIDFVYLINFRFSVFPLREIGRNSGRQLKMIFARRVVVLRCLPGARVFGLECSRTPIHY